MIGWIVRFSARTHLLHTNIEEILIMNTAFVILRARLRVSHPLVHRCQNFIHDLPTVSFPVQVKLLANIPQLKQFCAQVAGVEDLDFARTVLNLPNQI